MKDLLRLSLLAPLAALSVGLPAFGQSAPSPSTAPDAATLARYDKNHNGTLDPDELALMQADQAKTAQAAIPSKPASGSADEVVELSPFQVVAPQDTGYYASNTMSGTRIASKVEDLGASITVVTKQQLVDTASIDINDVFKFESNTEGTYDYTAINSASPTTDSIQSSPATATRIRGIGAPNIAIGNFAGTARIPLDSYNIESLEISRGPSSTLFGLGSPSGTVNVNQSEANVSRASSETQLRGDSYGGYRSSLNLNRPILKNMLAIRIAALYSDNAYEQKPSSDLTKRVFGTATFKPFKTTTIKATYENYQESRQSPNALTPRDGVTEWLNNGKPVWNPLTFTATVNGVKGVPIPVGTGATAENTTLPAGLFANTTTYTRPSMFIDGGQVQLWEINRITTGSNPNAGTATDQRILASGSAYMRGLVNGGNLYQVPGINNKGLYDWTSINAVSTNWNHDNAAIYTAEIVQRLLDNLYVRGAWHLEASDSFNRNITNPPTLQIDVNQTLLDGRANPYFLRPYIQNIEPTIFRSPEYNDSLQANVVYQLDFAKIAGHKADGRPTWVSWLGHHTFQGYYESRHITDGTFRYREAITDPNHAWLQPPLAAANSLNYTNGAAIDRPSYRYYVGGPNSLGYQEGYAPPKSGVAGTFPFMWYNQTTGQWISEPATFGTAPYLTSQTRQEVTSRGAVVQDNFLDDRFVFTGGLRKDFNRTRNSNGAVDNTTTGFYDYTAISTYTGWTNATGMTRDINFVVKPLPMLGLTYHKSSSFQPQPQAVDLFGTVLPNTYSHGQDVGGFVNLFGNKLVLSVKIHKTTVMNDRNSDSTLGSRLVSLEDGTTSGVRFGLQNFANLVATSRLGANASPDQIAAVAATITQFTPGFQAALNSGQPIRGTNNLEAKGAEVDLTFNPTNNWAIKFTGAQTESINTSLENDLADYIAIRMPYWLTVKDDSGVLWWTDQNLQGGTSPQNFYTTSVGAPLKIDQALLGKSNPQVKKYSWRLLNSYRFNEGRLRGLGFGGALRWADKSVIGYLAAAPDPDGIVRSLDVNRGYYDPSRYAADVWTSYRVKLFNDRVTALVQLNLQNAFESGRLQVVGVNPDGNPFNYRIINPRKWVLSTTFSF